MAKTSTDRAKNNRRKAADDQTVPVEVDLLDDADETNDEQEEQAGPPPDPRLIPRAGELPGPEFFAFAVQHPEPSWIDLYVHRLKPAVVNIPPPEWPEGKKFPSYCEKVKGLITEQTGRVADFDWLLTQRGSGKYHCRLVDRRLKRTQNRLICESFIEISQYDTHPPILNDWRELVPCQENNWIIDKLLRAKIIKRTPEGGFVAYEGPAANGQPNTDPSVMFDKAMAGAERIARLMAPKEKETSSPFQQIDIVSLMEKTQTANDPQKIINAAKSLVEISKPKENTEGQQLLTFVMQRLNAAEERATALLTKMLESKANPATDDVKKVADIIEAVDRIRGGTESEAVKQSRMSGTQEFVSELTKAFAPGVNQFLGVFGTFLNLQMQQKMREQAQQPKPTTPTARPAAPQQPAQVPAPQPNTPSAQPPQPATAPAPNEPADQQAAADQTESQEQTAMNQAQAEARIIASGLSSVGPTLVKYFEDEELTASDFAAWFCDAALPTGLPYPELINGYDAFPVLKKYSGENIRELIKVSVPPLYMRLAPTPEKEDALLKFLQEFLAYDLEAEPEVKK